MMKIIKPTVTLTDKVQIDFPRLESWNPITKVATIAATVQKKRVLCRISMEILKEKFHASTDNPLHAIRQNRQLIEAAARQLILSNAYEKDGSIVIDARFLD